MENLDIQDKLRGFDYDIILKSIKSYLEMFKSADIETLYLASGLIYQDQYFLNWLKFKPNFHFFTFKYYLQVINDPNCPGNIKYLYFTRITAVLSRLYKNITNCFYGTKE